MGASQDQKLIDETLEYIMKKARDQDVIYFFTGLGDNPKSRRVLVEFFKKHYDTVCLRPSVYGMSATNFLPHPALQKI